MFGIRLIYAVRSPFTSARTIVTIETIHTLIADSSGDQVCNDVQWLL